MIFYTLLYYRCFRIAVYSARIEDFILTPLSPNLLFEHLCRLLLTTIEPSKVYVK
jgi:hypothetical protein